MPRPPESRRRRSRTGVAQPINLVLYVSRSSRHTPTAQRNCEDVLARFDPRAIRFEICDVSAHPERAESDAVLFTPTLVKVQPPPRIYVLGDLSNAGPILDLLEACGVRPTR